MHTDLANKTVLLNNAEVPSVVSSVSVVAGDQEVAIAWTASDNNGSPITNYIVQYSDNGGVTWSPVNKLVSTTTNAVVTGLFNSMTYVFRVAAVNIVGQGDFSISSKAVMTNGLPTSLPSLSTQSYGTVIIQDGIYSISKPEGTSGFATYPISEGVLSPTFSPKADAKAFVVDIRYLDYKYMYSGQRPLPTVIPVSYDKRYIRVASDKNTVGQVKAFITQFASCTEAQKVRRRAIALSNIHKSISDYTFRFPVQKP
jgi:hypothetical protein